MDPVTHYAAGLALARLLRADRETTRAILIASLIPDIDSLAIVGGVGTFRAWHRLLTHNLLAVPVLTVIVALPFWRAGRRHLWAYAALAILVHLALDLLNVPRSILSFMAPSADAAGGTHPTGTAYLWPFSADRFGLMGLLGYGETAAWLVYGAVLVAGWVLLAILLSRQGSPLEPWRSPRPKVK